jgi:hypothetical protein
MVGSHWQLVGVRVIEPFYTDDQVARMLDPEGARVTALDPHRAPGRAPHGN